MEALGVGVEERGIMGLFWLPEQNTTDSRKMKTRWIGFGGNLRLVK